MWQANVGSGSGRATTYRDLLVKIVAFATSRGVDTVAVNAGGTGYVVGDVLTLPHAGAYLLARFEVTSVGGGGAVTGLRITSNGAYANRLASATVSAAGTGYAVGNILEVQGGSARCKAKVQVATISGSGVATVTVFEDGGAYSSTPSNPASTTKVGPTAGTGSGCTLTGTYTGLVGTSAVATAGGTGTGCTVDITLAETGWSCERNTNNTTFNSLTDEKEVVLKGDATGRTNKPYVGFCTGTTTSGINTRPFIAPIGMIAHNPALSNIAAQPNILGTPATFPDNLPYMCCDENAVQEMDFWITADDFRIGGVFNINSGAVTTDDGQYMHWYAGFMDTFATESENPYPMFIGATARSRNQDPSVASLNFSGVAECITSTALSTGWYYYRVETSSWVNVLNSTNNQTDTYCVDGMLPMAKIREPNSGATNEGLRWLATYGLASIYIGIGSTGRASSTRRLMPVPGTTPALFPIPLTVVSRQGSTQDPTLDMPRGQLRGFFWVFNTNAAGATISNFSEDYVTIGSDRYRVFHNHLNNAIYQFICIKEDV